MHGPEIFVVFQRMFLPKNKALDSLAQRIDARTAEIEAEQRELKDIITSVTRKVAQ